MALLIVSNPRAARIPAHIRVRAALVRLRTLLHASDGRRHVCSVTMSCVEIYNETVRDLLPSPASSSCEDDPARAMRRSGSRDSHARCGAQAKRGGASGRHPRDGCPVVRTCSLKVQSSCEGPQAWVEGATFREVCTASEAVSVLAGALRSRAVGSTDCNARSSRSHWYVLSLMPVLLLYPVAKR